MGREWILPPKGLFENQQTDHARTAPYVVIKRNPIDKRKLVQINGDQGWMVLREKKKGK